MLYYQGNQLEKIAMEKTTDIFVIGGGINGTAIAADAAGRGLSVILCEKGDLASGTSSASTKLIHGGLRYLEFYEFNLVRQALKEREVLMQRAPNIIKPLEFVLPYEHHLRPFWLIRLGLFIYDHLAKRHYLPASKTIQFEQDERGKNLLPFFKKGCSYYDCFTDDARLVILNAISAKEHGASILTHTQFISARREENAWHIKLKDRKKEYTVFAKAIINAAGPWVKEVQCNIIDSQLKFSINLDKGSHIVVPKLYEGNFAYILQNKDNRIIFAIPYQHQFTLIGTTDISVQNPLDDIRINEAEINYLCEVVNQYFKKTIQPNDIVWSYSGIRCLQTDHDRNPSTLTRDYKILMESDLSPPLLTVIGGKITTHRTLAENVINHLKPFFAAMGPSWTTTQPLPGCDFKVGVDNFIHELKEHYPWLPEDVRSRYVNNYGIRALDILKDTKNITDLGEEIAAGLYPKEVEYLVQQEWAETSEDILWRRTKLGLFFSEVDIEKLNSLCKAISAHS